jgi:hypothetical protein
MGYRLAGVLPYGTTSIKLEFFFSFSLAKNYDAAPECQQPLPMMNISCYKQ